MDFVKFRIALICIYLGVIFDLCNTQQCPRKPSRKRYAMYVWTNGFDPGISDCDLSKFLEWDENGPCFTHVWNTKTKRDWLWATCNRAGREIDTIFVSDVRNNLKAAYDSGNCATPEIATVKEMLREGHTRVPNLKIYGLYAASDIGVSEKDMVKYIVHYNDVCAESAIERFDGVATNNEAYAGIKCGDLTDRRLYLDNLQKIVTEARNQTNGILLTHYSVGWHWGLCDGSESLMSWNGKNSDVIHHMIDIFDSIDVQVGYITYPAVSERMIIAGYEYALASNKQIFTTLYTNPSTPCQTTFFPDDTCSIPGHSEAAMFSIIDGFSTNNIPYARACIHYFRGVYSAGVHPDWPIHNG